MAVEQRIVSTAMEEGIPQLMIIAKPAFSVTAVVVANAFIVMVMEQSVAQLAMQLEKLFATKM